MKHSENRVQRIMSKPMYRQTNTIPLKYNFIRYELIVIYSVLIRRIGYTKRSAK